MSKTTSNKFRITCKCGKKYLVRADLAGRKARCRNCHEELELKRRVAKKEPMWCPVCFSKLDRKDPVCKSCNRKNEEHVPVPEIPENTPGRLSLLPAAIINRLPRSLFLWIWFLICLMLVIAISSLQTGWDGPAFLTVFFFLGLGMLVLFYIARLKSQLITSLLVIGILAYESIALIRIWYGSTHGMSHFGILAGLMLGGPVLFLFVAYDKAGYSNYSSCGSNCSSCGSCGSSCGGGCGGGGCGGCGGD